MLTLQFSQRLGDHLLEVDTTLPAHGITAVFGVSGAGKTSLINAISGLTQPQQGRIQINDRAGCSTARAASICRRSSGVSAMCFRMRDCFRTIGCAATCSTAWQRQ